MSRSTRAVAQPSKRHRLRIAMVVGVFPTISETFIVNQILGLIAQGHHVDIFSVARPRQEPVHEAVLRNGLLARTYYLRDDGQTAVGRFLTTVRRILSSRRWFSPPGFGSMRRILRAHRHGIRFSRSALVAITSREFLDGPYDIVHCQFGDLGARWLPVIRAGLLHGALVTSIRGHDVTQNTRYDSGYYSDLFRDSQLMLPVSESLARRLAELGCPPEKIEVLHSGIDCSRFEFRPRTLDEGEPVRLLSVARLVEMKGIGYAIEAISQLAESDRRVRYDIVGDGPLRGELESLIRKLGVQDIVRIIGWRAQEELSVFLKEAHIFVAPSVTASNGETEGIPNAVKEAMAVGLPIVATEHSGIPELVADGVSGLLVPERNADAMATAIATLCDHPERWPEMGRAGRARVEEQFDTQQLSRRLIGLYAAMYERARA